MKTISAEKVIAISSVPLLVKVRSLKNKPVNTI